VSAWMCIPRMNLWIHESIFIKLGMYTTAAEPILKAYFINFSPSVLYEYHPIVARQRLGKRVPAETNTRDNIRNTGLARFLYCSWSIKKESVGLSVCPQFQYIYRRSWRFRDSSVGIATGYGLDNRLFGVRVSVGSRLFSSPRRPDWLWDSPNLL
jgi:hypothetical protein